VIVGVLAQLAWAGVIQAADPQNRGDNGESTIDATPFLVIGSVGSALLVCVILLHVPEGIQRARQTHRDNQEFKDRFR
jgi:hypothetical protein